MIKLLKTEINQNSIPRATLDVGRLFMVNATKTTVIFGLMPFGTMIAAAVMLRVGVVSVDYLCSRIQSGSLEGYISYM